MSVIDRATGSEYYLAELRSRFRLRNEAADCFEIQAGRVPFGHAGLDRLQRRIKITSTVTLSARGCC